MLRDKEEFILDVRRAARAEGQPVVTTDSALLDPVSLSRTIAKAALWLTPAITKGYNAAHFTDWSESERSELDAAVNAFRSVAGQVSGNGAPSADQLRTGFQAFQRLKQAVRGPVLSEWKAAAESLMQMVEQWAQENHWPTRRKPKELEESLLGKYALPQLLISADEELYVCSPIARFAPHSLGSYELTIQPSFDVNTVYRAWDEKWYVRLPPSGGREFEEVPLDKANLERAIEGLKALQ